MGFAPQRRLDVGVLGATGLVGQRLLALLQDHPWFRVGMVAASDRSAGRAYGEAVPWNLPGAPPEDCASLTLRRCEPNEASGCDAVFSALDADVAREVEAEFAKAGFPVITNSSAHRMEPRVPILVPEVNAGHLALLDGSRAGRGRGYIVANPNCSAAGLVIPIAALHRAVGVRRIVVCTLQAVSGAGASGPRALDLADNVVPWIPGEEEKIERETRKMLGTFRDGTIREAEIDVSAHCHRVGTTDGHLEAVSVELSREMSVDQAEQAFRHYRGDVCELGLPSSPSPVIEVRNEPDRPQPRRDRDAGGGMSVVVGRVRPCPVLSLRFELLSHNTLRGAAGAAILNAELLLARGWIGEGPAQ